MLTGYHYRITVEISNSSDSQWKGGEYAILSVTLYGKTGTIPAVKLTER